MSDSSINLSSRGAFSYNWNKGIDSNNYFLIRLGKSLLGFFKGLFCGYTVSKVEIDKFLENRDHRNSIFSKECQKKLGRFNVNPNYESVNGGGDKAELDEGVEILYGHQMRDKVYKTKLDNDVSSSRESIDGDTLEGEGMDVDTLEGEDSMSNASEVEELKSLMNVENFSVDNDRFSIENLRSLKADDCFCLFNHALNKNHSEIALRLLLTGNCDRFQYFTLEKKADILHFFMGLGLVSEVEALLKNGIVDVNIPDHYGRTLLMIAAHRGQEKLLTAVMVNADVNASDHRGFTPLHYAAVTGQEESLKLLLAAGALIRHSISNLCSTTPLHNAIMRDHIEGRCQGVTG